MQSREEYAQDLFVREDELLFAVRESITANGMPAISVPAELGKLLTLLVAMSGARNILEIGALGGYSGICLARGLTQGGRLTSLELHDKHAGLARANLARAGFSHAVEYRIGDARASLAALIEEGARYDFFFIDADKENYPHYLDYALRLASPSAIIAADNVLLGDRVLDPDIRDASVEAMREFNRRLAQDDRLDAMLLPIRDGFAVARVK